MVDSTAPSDVRALLLIVDDDPAAVHQLHDVARGLGDVRFCLNGEDALRMIRDARPDLVLLDMELPGISGEDTCRAIRRHLEPAELPVIFVTAHADPEREARALEIGGNDFILKPFNPPVARARIETHLALKRRTDQLLRMTHTDPLTGLANRRLFDLTLEREWRRAVRNALPLAVLMVDVDHFKAYNDAFGHPQGDACLRQVGHTIREMVQRAGELAARYGGEEFTVMLPHSEATQALRCADKIHEAIAACHIPHFAVPGHERLTVSIGLSAYDPAAGATSRQLALVLDDLADEASIARRFSPDGLLGVADRALYRAKAHGRNQSQFIALGDFSE